MIPPILDPRDGDIEDDASSTKRRSLLWLAGSLLAEISLPKLAATWLLLIGLPGLLLGAAPLLVSLWVAAVWSKAATIFTEILPILLLPPLIALGWFAGQKLLRLAESSFWSLNALAVQPVYIVGREGLRHLAEALLPRLGEDRRARMRAATAAVAGVAIFLLGIGVVAIVWPATRWVGNLGNLAAPRLVAPVLLANGTVLILAYFAVAALVWGFADATMGQARDHGGFAAPRPGDKTWRVAHLSDLHTVAEPYGFRIESGRSGPRGNDRLTAVLARLAILHAADPLDFLVITGDLTDAGRSGEWAAFFTALEAYPALAARVVALPGNHDVNVVDRAVPARMELPGSPMQRLRQVRMICALARLHGDRLRVVDPATGQPGATLAEALTPRAHEIAAFADTGSAARGRALAGLWHEVFPMVLPPGAEDGLGIIVLNSNAATHFSFTNALGLMSAAQTRALTAVTRRYPRAGWIIALHHHVVEYPQPAKALSERIGTALINGSWFIRRLRTLAGRAVILHGHRHIDWIGAYGEMSIVSAPSPVMEAEHYFYVHTLAMGADTKLRLRCPERVDIG